MKKFFIGIDFAKTKFDVVVLSKDDLVSKGEYNQFCNTKDGVKQLEKWLRQVCGNDVITECVICGENTGVYSVLAAKMLTRDGYTVCLESALRIKRSMGISRSKRVCSPSLRQAGGLSGAVTDIRGPQNIIYPETSVGQAEK